MPQCMNRGDGHIINDHLQAINCCVSRAVDTFCVTASPRHELKSKFYEFFLSDIWAVRLLGYSFSFCKLQLSHLCQSIGVTMHVVMN